MFKKIINLLLNLIIVLLVIIAILISAGFIQLKVLNKEYINIFGYSMFTTETASMSNTIKIGDIVIVKINDSYKENDIITYKEGSAFITHRVIKIDGDDIVTKGDNNNTKDETIHSKDVLGKVVFIFKDVETWKKVFRDKNVLIPISITIILFIAIVLYKDKVGETNEK